MNANKGYRAVVKNLPISPSKIRPIADHIRRKSCVDALAILESLPHKGALYLRKLIQSATSNATFLNPNIDDDSLFIVQLLVDGGPSRKTVWQRSRGKADRQIKRSSHISVLLDYKVVE